MQNRDARLSLIPIGAIPISLVNYRSPRRHRSANRCAAQIALNTSGLRCSGRITPHKRACVWRPAGRRRPAERQDPQIRAENLAHHLAPFIHPITNDSPHTFRHPPPWTVLCADRGGAEGGMAAAGGVSGAGVRVKIPRSGLQDNQDNE